MLRIPWDLDEARGDAGSNMPQLIKMHGCVTEPDSIVITREDYMRYADNNGALRGLLSEMLMQRELVWVAPHTIERVILLPSLAAYFLTPLYTPSTHPVQTQ